MDEVQLTLECNVLATKKQHIEQLEFNNKGGAGQNAEHPHDKCPLLATLTDNKQTELSSQSLKSENIYLQKTVAHESRNSSKNMPRFSSNDMVHNHYLEEARKKTQEKGRNSEPSVMPSTRS
ncbi:hypothetical protein Tco_1173817 [Tanacetum coccineum]